MKKILYFHLNNCPYCHQANKWLDELITENPQYASLQIQRVEETQDSDISEQYDYYYVPTFYVDGAKKHEGIASKEKIKAVLDAAL